MSKKISAGATKDDGGKIRFDLIPPEIEEELARVVTYGANKYGARNCEKGFGYGRLYAAARRHLNAFWSGEDRDKESGLPHLSHALWNIGMLIVQQQRRIGEDDRSQGQTTFDRLLQRN